MKRRRLLSLGLFGLLTAALGGCGGAEPARSALPPTANEPTIVAAMVSPLTKETPLQAVLVFAFDPSEKLISPATELLGFISKQRTEGGFGKEPQKTLLLDPAPAPAKAERLLYVAMGPRDAFSLDRVKAAGATVMRETIRLGVEHMAFAPIARDQGVTSLPPEDVAAAFIEGALVEYHAVRRATPDMPIALREVTFEAGAPFIDAVTQAVARGVAAAHARVQEGPPAR
ncbi:Peptidase M17, leucyl aminopeptidase-like protein [Minicystis rosea]|nr:Peptidase M17, leucyl aminopeptidase-like protein [Minicystis rosea]